MIINVTRKIKETIIEYNPCITIANIPAAAIPVPMNKAGFPTAFAYPSLSSVLSNTFPCIPEKLPLNSEMLRIIIIAEQNHIIILKPIIRSNSSHNIRFGA